MSLTDSSSDFSHGYMDQLRLPMLTIPSKQGVTVDLTSVLAELIRTEFGEDPTHFRQEVREFNQLRESAIRPSRDNNGTSTVRRYYAQLCLLPTRFAAARSSLQVTFIWSDAFTEKESANSLLVSETSAVLFNLGALHSRLGSDLPDELRSACTHFQCSAGVFYLLQTSVLSSYITPANTQIDMCSEIIAFCKNLMLAQAQECMVEKSLLERKRPSLVTKVAWEVSTLYQKAIDLLDSQIGSQVAKKNKNWQKFLQTKFHIYQCVANYCQALSSEEETNYGQSIGYLQLSTDNILAASKVVKVLQPPLKNAVKYLTELVQTKTQSATQANSQVYHQLVPQYAELEEITGALLVKPIEFSTSDKSVLGTDIFCKLVPMSVLESSSLYSEEKANLLRSVCESIQEKDRELGEFLSRIDVDEVLSYNDSKVHIPSDVAAVRTEVSREEGRVEGMEALLQSVLQLSNQIHRKLDEVCMYLTRDSPELANQIVEFQSQADKIDEYLLQGDKSNQELQQVMKELKPKLALLTATEQTFANSLPKIDLMTVTFDEAAESRLQLLMEKIQEMQTQRSALEHQLRRDMDSDDITNQLIASNGSNREEVFGMGMKKHKDAVAVIRQNCQAQDNILKAMTETNASLAGLRKELNSVRTERENVFKGLVEAWKRLGSTEESLKDGMKFYQNLDRKTLKLFDTIKSDLPPPPIQQLSSSVTPSIPLPDSSYKPISPFMSPPTDSLRPPVPSRRLKPFNQTEETPGIVDETELGLLDWAASKQENKQVNNEPEPVKETYEVTPVITTAKPTEPHIPAAPILATPVFDTSGLTQLIQSTQSESNVSFSSLQTGLSGMNQSVAEISANVSAVLNHNSQSNAAISSLHQVITNQNASIEQLSSHLQTANQNVVYTSQLIKLVETSLLAKIESVEKYTQDSVSGLNQLFEHVTQKQMDVVLKLEPLISKINNSISSTSEEVATLQTAVNEVKEDLRQIRDKQDSILLLPNQSDVRATSDPLSFQDKPKEGPSQVGELWDLLGKKPEVVSARVGSVVPSDNTAFSPISHRAPSVQSEPGVASQSMVLPVLSQSITSLDPFPTASMVPLSYSQQPTHSQPQFQSSVAPVSVPHTPQPSVMPIQALHSTPAVSHVQQFPYQQLLPPITNVLTPQPSPSSQYPLQPLPLQPTVQLNPQLSLQSAVQPTVQLNPQVPLQSAVQLNPQVPLQSAVQLNPQVPLQQTGQLNPQVPLQQTVQPNPQLSLQSAVQSNPQLSLQPAVQPNAPLTPQQHAYLQMVQKQLSSNSQPLTPDQLIIIQKQLLLLSQPHQ